MRGWKKMSMAVALTTMTGLGASSALAWDGFCGDGGPHGPRHGGHGMWAGGYDPALITERAEWRLAQLEPALAIRAEQRDAWNGFANAVTARALKMAELRSAMQQEGMPSTTPERLERMEKMMQLRQEGFAEVRNAIEALYAVLDDRQKTTFDAQWFGGFRGKSGYGPRSGKGSGAGQSGGRGGNANRW